MNNLIQTILYNFIPSINRFFGQNKKYNNLLIYYCSNFSLSGGLTDRLKGIMTAYQLSLATKREFKIIFNKPFKIKKILDQNIMNWKIDSENKEKRILSVAKHYDFINETNKDQVVINIKNIIDDKNNVLALRINQDYIKIINNMNLTRKKSWNDCFNDLFKFTEFTQKALDRHLELYDWDRVIGVHCRFLNLLGDNLESGEELSNGNKNILIKKIIKKLYDLLSDSPECKILLCSDSINFLKIVIKDNALKDKLVIIAGKPKHSERQEVSDQNLEKIVIDFFLLSECYKIFSITYNKMYPSAFPKYSSKIKNREFIVIS